MTYDLATPGVARLWTHEPDWSAGYRVRRAFLTDIFAARSSREQRRAIRDAPRLSVEYSAVVSGDAQRAADQFLRGGMNRPAAMPDFSRYVASTGASLLGASALTIASPPAWATVGQVLVLCGAGGVFEAVVVESIAGATINLVDPLAHAWPAGSIVRPGLFGLLGAAQGSLYTPAASRLALSFNVYPGGEPPEDEGAATDTFNGLEVLGQEPDWSGPPSMDYVWPVEQIDYGHGRTAQFRPVPQLLGVLEAQFTGLSVASATALEQVFLRAKGMRGSFYRSTCRPDMVLHADVTGATIAVEGSAIADDFGATDFAAVSQAVEIVQRDGTRLRRLVTDIAPSGGNTAVTLNSSVTLTTATTARISWLPRVRFASDELVTEWITPQLATIRTAFQQVLV
jgi:hypothetical protein